MTFTVEKFDRRDGIHRPLINPKTGKPFTFRDLESAKHYLAAVSRNDPQAWIYQVTRTH